MTKREIKADLAKQAGAATFKSDTPTPGARWVDACRKAKQARTMLAYGDTRALIEIARDLR